jgi:hypothetical protein
MLRNIRRDFERRDGGEIHHLKWRQTGTESSTSLGSWTLAKHIQSENSHRSIGGSDCPLIDTKTICQWPLHLQKQLHLDYQDLGHITGALAIAMEAAALFTGHLADKIGPAPILHSEGSSRRSESDPRWTASRIQAGRDRGVSKRPNQPAFHFCGR